MKATCEAVLLIASTFQAGLLICILQEKLGYTDLSRENLQAGNAVSGENGEGKTLGVGLEGRKMRDFATWKVAWGSEPNCMAALKGLGWLDKLINNGK